ncbi:pyridoxamine 5'-phosphate oxidase family protein [Streptomyces sp. SID3343]|nr:pyridoxamine 5'-phosphate oxidase family protein [Streptomyces sp. SID3343]MYW01942.1 pyridoxamine 5'-phosphate oxidase family protein [Streptomyces sp. SID3343]
MLDAAVRIVRARPYGSLATTDADGRPRVRIVQHLAVEDDATVWFGTSPRTRKAAELTARPEVCYSVLRDDGKASAYAALYARAEVIADPAELRARWIDELAPFFPAGPAGGDIVLVRLAPHRVEVLDFGAGIHPDPFGLAAAITERGPGGWA